MGDEELEAALIEWGFYTNIDRYRMNCAALAVYYGSFFLDNALVGCYHPRPRAHHFIALDDEAA